MIIGQCDSVLEWLNCHNNCSIRACWCQIGDSITVMLRLMANYVESLYLINTVVKSYTLLTLTVSELIIRLSKGLKFSYQFTWPKKRSLKEPASSSGAIFDATVWQFLFLSLLTFRLLKIGPLNKMSNKSYTTVYLLTHASNSLQPLLDQGHLWWK